MSDIIINGNTYNGVDTISVQDTTGGTATYTDNKLVLDDIAALDSRVSSVETNKANNSDLESLSTRVGTLETKTPAKLKLKYNGHNQISENEDGTIKYDQTNASYQEFDTTSAVETDPIVTSSALNEFVTAYNKVVGRVATLETTDFIKSTDYGTNTKPGLVKYSEQGGTAIDATGKLYLVSATDTTITNKVSGVNHPLMPKNIDLVVKTGITTNTLTLSATEKTAAQTWLGIDTAIANALPTNVSQLTNDSGYLTAADLTKSTVSTGSGDTSTTVTLEEVANKATTSIQPDDAASTDDIDGLFD